MILYTLGDLEPLEYDFSIIKLSSLDGYTPKNKKLLTFPYCYMLMSNNTGISNTLHYENFKSTDCEFLIKGIPTAGCSIKCVPQNYGVSGSSNEEEGILAGQLPILNFNKNLYADWLLTNSNSLNVNRNYGVISGILGIGGLITGIALTGVNPIAGAGATLGGISAMFSGAKQIDSTNALDRDKQMIPTSLNTLSNTSEINACSNTNGFWFYDYTIKREFAKNIDNYFDMFGYKVNSVEIPQLSTRVNWNYLRIIDPNVEGNNIPEKDLNIYKQMLTNGITFWHNPNTFRDYSQSNGNS